MSEILVPPPALWTAPFREGTSPLAELSLEAACHQRGASLRGGKAPSQVTAPKGRFTLVALIVGLLRLYQKVISPLLPPSCRFYPTCSQYAIEALRSRGLLWGIVLTLGRLCRCHPFHPGGCDPVPPTAPSQGRA